MSRYFHVLRPQCPAEAKGEPCQDRQNDVHRSTFSHASVQDIQPICNKRPCDEGQAHFVSHIHPSPACGACDIRGLNAGIDFDTNHRLYLDLAEDFVPILLAEYVYKFRAIHRCNFEVFKSMVDHGSIISINFMRTLRTPKNAIDEVLAHPDFELHVNSLTSRSAIDNLKRLAEVIVHKTYLGNINLGLVGQVDDDRFAHIDDINRRIGEQKTALSPMLPDDNGCERFEAFVIRVSKACVELATLENKKFGIGFGSDKDMGTDLQVFASFGPNTGHFYGYSA